MLLERTVDIWGDIPTWVTAIGTVGAVIVALYFSGRDSRARARERRMHQAENVTAWLGPPDFHDGDLSQRPSVNVSILNDSSQLAYRVIATVTPVRGTVPADWRAKGNYFPEDFRVFIGELAPGTTIRTLPYAGGGHHIRWAIELAFRDAAGRTWVRGTDGRLKQIDKEPADYYGLHEPLPW
jgi:hypothetical protein